MERDNQGSDTAVVEQVDRQVTDMISEGGVTAERGASCEPAFKIKGFESQEAHKDWVRIVEDRSSMDG